MCVCVCVVCACKDACTRTGQHKYCMDGDTALRCVTDLPLGNEEQSVEAVEELRGGLVDAGDDRLPFLVSQLLQSSEEGEGSAAVQP